MHYAGDLQVTPPTRELSDREYIASIVGELLEQTTPETEDKLYAELNDMVERDELCAFGQAKLLPKEACTPQELLINELEPWDVLKPKLGPLLVMKRRLLVSVAA